MRKDKVVVHLSGGLGNQMFQHMAGIGLARTTERETLVNANWLLNAFNPQANLKSVLPILASDSR